MVTKANRRRAVKVASKSQAKRVAELGGEPVIPASIRKDAQLGGQWVESATIGDMPSGIDLGEPWSIRIVTHAAAAVSGAIAMGLVWAVSAWAGWV